MARIRIPSEKSTNPQVKEVFDEIKSIRKTVPAPYRAFSLLPHILQANWNKTKQVSRNGNLPLVLKEQIALAVSAANNCEFCVHIHTANLRKLGLNDKEIISVSNAEVADPKTDFVLKFVVQATKDPHALTDKDFKKLKDFGYQDKDILEILTVMEMYTGYNKIISALKIKIDD